MISRRELLQLSAATSVLSLACQRDGGPSGPVVLNDIHSQLNATRVARVVRPGSQTGLASAIREAARQGQAISVAGGRHSMGGQQFGADTLHLDTRGLDRVLALDRDAGTIEVEAGIQWPELIDWCVANQQDDGSRWGIRQKQTGADRLTLGGALASNVHGRGLSYPPIVADVEALTLLDATGDPHRCTREENPELFRLVIGGYGLFGVVYSIVLRLAPRQKIERIVEVRSVEGLEQAFEERIADGFLFGDFQFKTDETAEDFLRTGVFSCYRQVSYATATPERQKRLPRTAWRRLLDLAHFDKARAFDEYAKYYLSTTGQIYWSDSHQLSYYLDDYHAPLDRRSMNPVPGTEMISEVYVPRDRLALFMDRAADGLRDAGVNVIYGTVRMIEPDTETFLPWARERWACIVFNLHVDHSPEGLERAQRQFRLLIDLAREQGGSYFLTYHRWANRTQVEACYPQMTEFLARKLEWDPTERFQSDWYRYYRQMFAADL